MNKTKMILKMKRLLLVSVMMMAFSKTTAQTMALWKFDEAIGLYPSHIIDDASDNDYPLVLGKQGKIVKGKFGNGLDMTLEYDLEVKLNDQIQFGLKIPPIPKGRSAIPMYWGNANFAALMTVGEKHLRNQVGFVNPSKTKLNLGNFDWTIGFWYFPKINSENEGTIFEIGQGPLREETTFTRLSVLNDRTGFVLRNKGLENSLFIKSRQKYLSEQGKKWHYFVFEYNSKKEAITHYADGRKISETACKIKAFSESEEAYFTVGRDGHWENVLPGILDELEFNQGIKYGKNFKPKSLENAVGSNFELIKGLPLLFSTENKSSILNLGTRKHVFIDDAILDEKDESIDFVVNPPKQMERVIGNIKGSFRKHLTVLEDEDGNIRMYNSLENDYLAMHISKDGLHFEAPDFGKSEDGSPNIVIPMINGGMGNPFIDPNGPDETRYKFLSNYHKRGVYLYTSPNGVDWTRSKTAILPFRPGSQSCTFYDEQTREYVSYHRTDMLETPAGATLRGSILARMKDISKSINYKQLTQKEYDKASKKLPMREPQPWFMDNGPLTPGGFGIEFPLRFLPIPEDPVGSDIYVTKAQKYAWAPDTYVAFPIIYFHYEEDGPKTRTTLMDPARLRGEGPLETQLSVSRDGLNWKRYPRPTYVGIGEYMDKDIHTAYLAHGMIKRGNEIWQYYFAETQYHSAYTKEPEGRGVYRLVQRLDGFVSMDSPYGKEAQVITKPFIFLGNQLHLNVDTDAAGYVQVGFLDENSNPIGGFSVDDCVYINGDFVDTTVEWMGKKDLSALAGKQVKMVLRMRGSKVYAFQFKE